MPCIQDTLQRQRQLEQAFKQKEDYRHNQCRQHICSLAILYAKNAEDQRVFEDLFQRHIKGNEQQIDVKPHKEIENAERHDGKIADIRPERAGHSHKIGKIKHQQKDCNNVDQPKQKALLEVSANGVGIIRREKDGLAAHHAAQNVGRAHVLPAPRHQ